MADEVEQKENSSGSYSGDGDLPETEKLRESGVSEVGLAKLESLIAQKDEALTKIGVRLTELEQVVATKDGEIAQLKQAKTELEERLQTLSQTLVGAVASYRAIVVQANPEVVEELITGDTIELLNESLSKAKTLINKVRQGVEAEISLIKVPLGAPERTPLDFSGLSPREKIQYAIGGKK